MNVSHGSHPYAHFPQPIPAGRGRALPVVVASGLAMGVFVGLVIVRGTGEADRRGELAAASPVEPEPPNPAPSTAISPSGSDVASVSGADSAPGSVSDSASAPASGSASDSAPEPAAPTTATLRFDVSPPGATIYIDGRPLKGREASREASIDLTDGKAEVRIKVKARGYRSHSETLAVTGDRDVAIELKRAPRRPPRNDSPPSGPGGLLDL